MGNKSARLIQQRDINDNNDDNNNNNPPRSYGAVSSFDNLMNDIPDQEYQQYKNERESKAEFDQRYKKAKEFLEQANKTIEATMRNYYKNYKGDPKKLQLEQRIQRYLVGIEEALNEQALVNEYIEHLDAGRLANMGMFGGGIPKPQHYSAWKLEQQTKEKKQVAELKK